MDKLVSLIENEKDDLTISMQRELLDSYLLKITDEEIVGAFNQALTEYYFTEDEMAIYELIERNVDAMNNEDIDAYMADLDPSSPNYDLAKEPMELLFAEFDLLVELIEIEILEVTEDNATIRIIQQTTSLEESIFKDNIVEMIQGIKKVNDKWVLTEEVEIVSIEYLQ
ncbi:hypothetical protein IM538_21505 [Cytobacillus suaedae]|nr:hypothetical protein IM538_21505 [Cytobacillus suaedae]